MDVLSSAVVALKGISESVKVREIMSQTIIKQEPIVKQSGIEYLVFLPIINLVMCGTTRPTQAIFPQKQTEIAVNRVAIIIMANLYVV